MKIKFSITIAAIFLTAILIPLIISLLRTNISINEKEIKYSQDKEYYFRININGKEDKIYFAQEPFNQIGKERKYIFKKVNKILELGGVNDSLLYFPVAIKADSEGNFYVLDQIARCVKKFSGRGKLLRIIGHEGTAPGEFKYPIRLFLDPNKNIYVYDDHSGLLTRFSKDIIQLRVKPGDSPTEFCPLDSSKIVVLKYSINSFDIITQYNIEGKIENIYKTILDARSKTKDFKFFGHIFMGDIIRLSSTRFVHIPECFNQLFFYNEKTLERIVTTIDKTSYPILFVESGPDFRHISYKSLDEYIINWAAFMVGEELIILNSKETKKDCLMLDVYCIIDGLYKHSIKLSGIGAFSAMEMTHNKIYVISDDSKVKIFSYE